jgi:hypothetical protein
MPASLLLLILSPLFHLLIVRECPISVHHHHTPAAAAAAACCESDRASVYSAPHPHSDIVSV